jgi:hypothetical protein
MSVQALLRTAYVPAVRQVDQLVDFELAHINTLHPDFIGAEKAYLLVKAGRDGEYLRNALPRAAGGAQTYPAAAVNVNARMRASGYLYPNAYGSRAQAGADRLLSASPTPSEEEEAALAEQAQGMGAEEDGEDEEGNDEDGAPLPDDDNEGEAEADAEAYEAGDAPNGYYRSAPSAAAAAAADQEAGDPEGASIAAGNSASSGNNNVARRSKPFAGPSVPVDADVEWAIKRVGGALPLTQAERKQLAAQQRAGQRRSATPLRPAYRRANPNNSSGQMRPQDSPANIHQRTDIGERFAAHIVNDIAGYSPTDPLPDGALRVGGPHSPFVARPRVASPFRGAGAAIPSRAAPSATGAGIAGGPSSMRGGSASGAEMVFGSQSGPGPYVHLGLATMPSKPLPAVITPQDLRATPKEAGEIRLIRVLLLSYLSIVRKTYEDLVPKVCTW